jgi:exodeoxyribonuclease VII small subunit
MVRAMAAAPQDPKSFEQIVTRLEAIAARLEGGDVQLEQALTLFEEGMTLSKTGGQRLDDAERRLEVLLADGQTQALPQDPNSPSS